MKHCCWSNHGSLSNQSHILRERWPLHLAGLQDAHLSLYIYLAPLVSQASLPPREHVAISGDNKGCSWHVVGRVQQCCATS